MKHVRVLRVVAAATLACVAAEAAAAEMANPTGFMYYGYGQGSFGYDGAGYTAGTRGYGVAEGTPPPHADYGNGYAAPGYAPAGYGGYPGYGYGGGSAGGHGSCEHGGRHARRRGHCCSFGGNCECCKNVWDGYRGPGNPEGGGCCGAPVKVYHRHRPLGRGAGPCVDAACGVATSGRRHHRHSHRRGRGGSGPVEINYAIGGAGGSEMMYDDSNMGGQPNLADPNGAEAIVPPSPSLESEDEPRPTPADDSSP